MGGARHAIRRCGGGVRAVAGEGAGNRGAIEGAALAEVGLGGAMDRFPLGFNTYSVRALRWHDLRLLEYAAGLKLDSVYLQDSIDPANNDAAHWKELKETAG